MKRSKFLFSALIAALGCVAQVQAFGQSYDDAIDSGATSRRLPAVRQVAANSYFDQSDEAAVPQSNFTANTATNNTAMPCSSACGGTAQSCCDPDYTLIATAEATFFWPQFNRQFLTSSIVTAGGGGGTVISNGSVNSTDGQMLAAPRIALGVQGEYWGVVARYWYASSWANGFQAVDPIGGAPGINNFDMFRAQTADIELQRRIGLGCWTMWGSGGVRWANVDNDRRLGVVVVDGDNLMTTSAFASQQFNGTGITAALQGVRPLGECCDGPISLFFVNRYSYLWGTGGAAVQTSASADTPLGSAQAINGAIASGSSNGLFIGEIQVGLQWDACLKCVPGRAFIRSGFEYQYWDNNAGIGAASFSAAGVLPPGVAAASTAAADDILFQLVGFNIGAGIMY